MLLCFLALLLTRVIEVERGQTWPSVPARARAHAPGRVPRLRRRVLQRTETTPAQLETLRALKIDEPPRFLAIEPAKAA